MKILVVENSSVIADRMIRTLKELPGDVEIAHATDVSELMWSLHRHRPAVVIVDPHIAGRRGMELLRGIKHRHPKVALIVLSNLSCAVHRRRCMKAGADCFLDKSTEFDHLAKLIR